MTVTLEIYYQNQLTNSVPEYSEVELRVRNFSTETPDITVRLNTTLIRVISELAPNSIYSFNYNVRDLVGELNFRVECSDIKIADPQPNVLKVVPQKLSLEDVYFIKFNRLPTVLSRLNAPNGLRLRYDEPPLQPHFDFFSPEYTAEKLLFFSCQFLEEGLAERILENLDYITPEQLNSSLGEVRGATHWQATLKHWFNQPEQRYLQHYWKNSPKVFATLPNFVFAKFQAEIAYSIIDLVNQFWLHSSTAKSLKSKVANLQERAFQHFKLYDIPEFNFDLSKIEPLEIDEKNIFLFKNTINPHYIYLLELWQEFQSRFVNLPENSSGVFSGLQPMSKIYEMWAVCEVAASLDLKYVPSSRKGLEPLSVAKFKGELNGKIISLAYNQGVREGWYSATRSGTPRPDILLEYDDKRILLDVKYRVEDNNRANSEDVYKMLAYMNDLGISTGGIIYPGDMALNLTTDRKGQNLAEIALRPPTTPEHNFSEELHDLLIKLFT